MNSPVCLWQTGLCSVRVGFLRVEGKDGFGRWLIADQSLDLSFQNGEWPKLKLRIALDATKVGVYLLPVIFGSDFSSTR